MQLAYLSTGCKVGQNGAAKVYLCSKAIALYTRKPLRVYKLLLLVLTEVWDGLFVEAVPQILQSKERSLFVWQVEER
jgi:hypothetical protein